MLTIEVVVAWVAACIAFFSLRRRRSREAEEVNVMPETYGDRVGSGRKDEEHYSA